ncbi:unnamed protein product [Paramecium pentaurelia]|uniref:RING-type domain-containing protein n=1 Tax=Paramecium pentaurelia TaxID=43138 RepID=A0A8S1UBV3_9CILI|nr:unnamed protein product [Paramecium pentaurelia]
MKQGYLFFLVGVQCILYQFNATNQYLLVENEVEEWKQMKIQIYEHNVKQIEAIENYEKYLQLYYKLKLGSYYELEIVIIPESNFKIQQINQKECPKQCSNNGICINTSCQCYELFFGSRCQFEIESYYNIQQYNIELHQFETSYLLLQYQQSDLINEQGQTKNMILQSNHRIEIQLYVVLPYQNISTSIQNQNILYNQSLNGSTTIDFSSFYQSYSSSSISYSFFFIFTNNYTNNQRYSITFELKSQEITFQDFILVTILSVVAFIILLIVIFIVRRRCQYIQISKLKYSIDNQPKIDIVGQLPIVTPAKDEECIVCLDLLENQQCRQTSCKHIFHEQCLNEWLQKQQTCPLCRDNLFEEEGAQIMKIRNLSSSSIVAGQFSIIQSERQPIQQIILSRSMNNRLAAFQ